ncbi:MAG TPA: beta-ketoacyl-ACP synthase III [Planctomycetota bacterium]|nr:beta-ketoacyl-ACP synthase III [Planctomycetota bacterium]
MPESFISGTGSYLPERRLTNFDIEKMVDTSNEWIVQRTGIRERRIARKDEATSDLAVAAARVALEASGRSAGDLEAIILCSVTPDTYMPAGAVYVQRALGAVGAVAFDLSAACTGFIYGLTVGSSLIRSGMYETILVIGAETLSRIIDFTDRNTCILFGDGAGAVILTNNSNPRTPDSLHLRVVDSYLRSDGNGCALIEMPGGGSRMPTTHETVEAKQHFLRMQGKEVFKFATKSMVELIEAALERNHLVPDDLGLIVPHQVNNRIIEAAIKKIAIPVERMILNLDRYGNTSAASVPIALHEAASSGRLKKGEYVLLVAFGAGLTWGYNLLKW